VWKPSYLQCRRGRAPLVVVASNLSPCRPYAAARQEPRFVSVGPSRHRSTATTRCGSFTPLGVPPAIPFSLETDAGADFDLALLTPRAVGRGRGPGPPGAPITLRREQERRRMRRHPVVALDVAREGIPRLRAVVSPTGALLRRSPALLRPARPCAFRCLPWPQARPAPHARRACPRRRPRVSPLLAHVLLVPDLGNPFVKLWPTFAQAERRDRRDGESRDRGQIGR
jgi:hypothetical protein